MAAKKKSTGRNIKRKAVKKTTLKARKTSKPSPSKPRHAAKIKDTHSGAFQTFGGINRGGLINPASGLGTPNDKSRQSFFTPTQFTAQTELEVINNESWAAERYIEMPVDMMFVRARVFEGVNEKELEAYEKYLDSFNLNLLLANAMKSGRLYGTAFLVFVTKEAPLTEPLDINLLREGDLLNILVFDRFSTSVYDREYRLVSKNFQKPSMYHVSPFYGGGFDIHASRMLRFDGKVPLTSNGWTSYNVDYGVSELVGVLQSIYQDAQGANGVSQLIEEASIPVIRFDGLKETLGANRPIDSASLEEFANTLNVFKSVYNTVYMDTTDQFDRLAVNFTGLPEILDRFAARLASASGIPQVIFLGKSPLGMNATGDSDIKVNALNVAAMQVNKLDPAYQRIDDIMTRTGGFNRDFTFEFPSLVDLSESEQADIAVKKMQVSVEGVQAGIMTTDESRAMLDGDAIIGTLEPQDFDFTSAVEKAQTEIGSQPNPPDEGTGEDFEESGEV
ncbi:MAG: DUF1073 domain-containing protein [Gammaproteobacteria bacterium]